jgi:hypothetical protein
MVCGTSFFTSVSEPVSGTNLMGVPTTAVAVFLAPKSENIQNKISVYNKTHKVVS